jgi:3-deoxy-D-manno-octulosonate 8-phosphate phosphatase KdsC-like HAD superfamily phosphatase
VRDALQYFCGTAGGDGAVREVSDLIRRHVVAKAEGQNGNGNGNGHGGSAST